MGEGAEFTLQGVGNVPWQLKIILRGAFNVFCAQKTARPVGGEGVLDSVSEETGRLG